MGQGEGCGEDTGTNVAVGSGVAVALTIFMCVCGLPMIIAGGVLVWIGYGSLWTIGIVLISIACILLVIGIIFVCLICCGVFGNDRNQVQPAVIHPRQNQPVMVISQQQNTGPQAGYPPYGHPGSYSGPPQYTTPRSNVPQPGQPQQPPYAPQTAAPTAPPPSYY